MSEETKKPFCVRGHARKKKGPCPVCVSDWRKRMKSDPVLFEEYKAKRREREYKPMPLTKAMKDHAKDVADRLNAIAIARAEKERKKRA